jgi:hypothetical protein
VPQTVTVTGWLADGSVEAEATVLAAAEEEGAAALGVAGAWHPANTLAQIIRLKRISATFFIFLPRFLFFYFGRLKIANKI